MEMNTNMLAPDLILAPAAPEEINPLTLLTIKPEEYVAQVFAPFRSKLAVLKAEADTIHFEDTRMFDAPHRYVDISTTEGMAIAVKYRAGFRDDVRLDVEKTKTARKAPILQIGRLIDSTYKEIVEEAAPYEGKFDAAIKAEEKRKAEVKAAKERAEAERIGGIKAAIEAIRALPARAEGKSADELRALLERVAVRVIANEEFAEFTDEAQATLDAAGQELVTMFGAAQQREVAAAEAEAARVAEVARLAAEQSAADQRRADEAAENARIAAENAATAQRLADQQAAIDRAAAEAKAQLEAVQAEIAAAQAAAKKLRDDAEEADRQRAAVEAERIANQQAAAARAERERQAAVDAVDQRTASTARTNVAADAAAAEVPASAAPEVARTASFYGETPRRAAPAPAAAPEALFDADFFTGTDLPAVSDSDIVTILVDDLGFTPAEAIDRLAKIDFAALRAQFAIAA